jgi:hypothetical protein
MDKMCESKNAKVFDQVINDKWEFSSNSSVDSRTKSESSLADSDEDDSYDEIENDETRRKKALDAFG